MSGKSYKLRTASKVKMHVNGGKEYDQGRPIPRVKVCQECYDMSWRRAFPKCETCGLKWEPEQVERESTGIGQSLHDIASRSDL